MAWGKKESGGGCLARLALLIAVLALVLAWAAWRRSGGRLDGLWDDVAGGSAARVEAGTDEAAAGWQAGLERARVRLLERKAEVEGDRNLQQVREDVAEIRQSLERATEAGAGIQEQWRDLDRELERLEIQLRDGSAKAKDTLDSVLDKLRRSEEDGGDGDRR